MGKDIHALGPPLRLACPAPIADGQQAQPVSTQQNPPSWAFLALPPTPHSWKGAGRPVAALPAQMTSLTTLFLLLLQAAHCIETRVLTSTLATGKLLSISVILLSSPIILLCILHCTLGPTEPQNNVRFLSKQ